MAAKNYRLMRCRDCGFPRLVSFAVKWNDNGTISQRMRKDFRVVILNHGFIDSLFSGIEAKLGLSIEHIAFEAQRNASKSVFESVVAHVPGMDLWRKFSTFKRLGVEQFNKVACITGQCNSTTLEYVPGVYGIARLKNPFHTGMMAANVVGAFEFLEGFPFEYTLEEEERDTYIIRIRRSERPEFAERMELDFAPLLPGHHTFERCPRCRVPLAIASQLKWMENDGIILDTRTATRVMMLDGYMVSAVFRELARELGDEIYEMMVDAQREWTVDHVGQLGLMESIGPLDSRALEKAYRDYLEGLALFGQGNPVEFSMSDRTIKVTVENPYEAHVLAGTLQGLYEALEKAPGRVTWDEPAPQVARYTVEPAGEPSGEGAGAGG
ncbi:MAG: hypothetical protein KKF41_02740 [Actinobacteria bacterium]|nr:hypothetical protein [Actinomycetota bacterium]MBU1945285.1 hypothetical protein [Actinomycetota bacterium]MBU2686485.1 hypothetical protein [Actinomycetota bacterium]